MMYLKVSILNVKQEKFTGKNGEPVEFVSWLVEPEGSDRPFKLTSSVLPELEQMDLQSLRGRIANLSLEVREKNGLPKLSVKAIDIVN